MESVLATDSDRQLDEIAAGLCKSGVHFLWPAGGKTERLRGVCGGDVGLVVPWCDQLRVLRHSSVGGFWTHCDWNSVREGVLAGVPFLTSAIMVDQFPNQKLIVEDWQVGLKVENLMTGDEIAGLVRRFMELESEEGKAMRKRSKKLQKMCLNSTSDETNIIPFITHVSLS